MKKWMDYKSNLNFVSGQVACDGALLFIESTLQELDYFERPVPKKDWTIRIIREDRVETVELKKVPLVPTEVDLFSDGTILLVQGRCLKEGKYEERNARRYNPNGQLVDAFTLGDGISHMQIDDTDTIWVSYFDEGIFGNMGWDQPMGSEGVVAYSVNGEKLWGAGEYGMIDCYALHVVNSKEVYFYYYDDFYLVKLSEMQEELRYRIEGEDSLEQFMFDEKGILAQIDHYTLKRYQYRKHSLAPKEKISLVDEKGKRIIGPVFMRGSQLYAYSKDGIYIKV